MMTGGLRGASNAARVGWRLLASLLVAGTAHAQSACQRIPGTQVPVGAACLARAAYPPLHAPVNPLSYGADPSGSTNSAAAFQRAVDIGHDVEVTCPVAMAQCTYQLSDADGQSSVLVTTNLNIQCAANVTLMNPDHDQQYTGMLTFSGVTGGGVQGCALLGANAGPAPLALTGGEANALVRILDSANVLLEGNTVGNTWADAAIELSTGAHGPGVTHAIVRYNTFTANPLYGLAITSGGDDRLENNLVIDSDMGVEANAGEAMSGHIVITSNLEIYQHGGCELRGNSGCNEGIGLTAGGTVDGFTGRDYRGYATNEVTGNYCTGAGVQHAEIYDTWNRYISPPPTYQGNVLGPGCACASGAPQC